MVDEYWIGTWWANLLYKIRPEFVYRGQRRLKKSVLEGAKGDPSRVKVPKLVMLEGTVVCNLRCPFCWWWGDKGIGFELVKGRNPLVTNELTIEQLKDVIDQTVGWKPSYYISGGEPFLKRNIIELIEYIDSRGLKIRMTSNGTLLDDHTIERLSKLRNLVINFSVDGPEDVHDSIRGNGMFSKTRHTIERLVELRGDRHYPFITTNTVFSPWIMGRIDELATTLGGTGIDLMSFQHLWFTNDVNAGKHMEFLKENFGVDDHGVKAHIMSPPDPAYVDRLIAETEMLTHKQYKKTVIMRPYMTPEEIRNYYLNANYFNPINCKVAWNSILVKANGDVMFCPDEWMTEYKIGNVRDRPISDMWLGNEANAFREVLGKHGAFPACARCCMINKI